MVPWRASPDGDVTEEVLAWYRRFALGEPGAIVVEATGIRDVPSGPLLRIGHDRFVSGLRRLTDTVRQASGGRTRILIQLIDFLAIRRRPERAKFYSRFLELTTRHREWLVELDRDLVWLSASGDEVRSRLSELSEAEEERVLTPRELESLRFGARESITDLELPQIRELPGRLPELFATAALRAERAGFDGIELHFAHAYTMASFLSRTNTRADGYGRTLEGRVRLPLEVYEATRSALAPTTLVGCRFLGDEVIEGGSRVEDAAWFGSRFAAAGMDFLSISKGGKFEDAKQPRVGEAAYPYTGPSGHECMPTVYSDEVGPFGRNLPLAREVRRAVQAAGFSTPVVGAGGIGTFSLAEGALVRGDCDVVAAARQSLADPDWWLKLRLGRGSEIRRCALTNYCEGLDQRHKRVTCRLWDREPPHEDGHRRLTAPPWDRSGSGPL
ncbi:MAG: NADH:flavin oxidoreductase [Deltaproteobacteria bacterium]|nr:NADH:flavin oxidoreductase [Deltaproteobacteria bacterium]